MPLVPRGSSSLATCPEGTRGLATKHPALNSQKPLLEERAIRCRLPPGCGSIGGGGGVPGNRDIFPLLPIPGHGRCAVILSRLLMAGEGTGLVPCPPERQSKRAGHPYAERWHCEQSAILGHARCCRVEAVSAYFGVAGRTQDVNLEPGKARPKGHQLSRGSSSLRRQSERPKPC